MKYQQFVEYYHRMCFNTIKYSFKSVHLNRSLCREPKIRSKELLKNAWPIWDQMLGIVERAFYHSQEQERWRMNHKRQIPDCLVSVRNDKITSLKII